MEMIGRTQKGFTLIEVIVVLLLVGVIAVMAGMWIVSIANGYIFTKMNMETTQKAQLAMTRLEREFSAISAVTTASTNASQITYTRPDMASGTLTGASRDAERYVASTEREYIDGFGQCLFSSLLRRCSSDVHFDMVFLFAHYCDYIDYEWREGCAVHICDTRCTPESLGGIVIRNSRYV